jgi:hypothetical protein
MENRSDKYIQIGSIAIVLFSVIMAAFSNLALAYDGSAYFFMSLDKQTPFTPNNRYVNILLHQPMLLLSQVTQNVKVLAFIFSLTYTLLPLLAIIFCWIIVRKINPKLIIWPVFSIGLISLPGQVNFISEGIISTHFFWPVLLAILVGFPAYSIPIVILLSIFLVLAHPFGGLLVGVGLVVSVLEGLRHKTASRKYWLSSIFFLILLVVAIIKFFSSGTSYEMGQISIAAFSSDFRLAIPGFQFTGLLCLAFVILITFVVSYTYKNPVNILRRFFLLFELTGLFFVGLFFILYAGDIHNWRNANLFSDFVFILNIPIMLIALIDSFQREAGEEAYIFKINLHRLRLISIVSIIYASVLLLQSYEWKQISDSLLADMSTSPWHCLSTSSLGYLWNTPLRSWTTPMYSVIIQGKTPDRVVLSADDCQNIDPRKGFQINKYQMRGWKNGWFDFTNLATHLLTEDPQNNSCWVRFTSDWSYKEENSNTWWRWTSGKGSKVNIYSPTIGTYTITGRIESKIVPNATSLTINGIQKGIFQSNDYGLQKFASIQIALDSGENVLQFNSAEEPISVTGDSRQLGIAIADLEIRNHANEVCQIRP